MKKGSIPSAPKGLHGRAFFLLLNSTTPLTKILACGACCENGTLVLLVKNGISYAKHARSVRH